MAQALAGGLIEGGAATPSDIEGSDVSEEARRAFERRTGGGASGNNRDVAARCRVLLLAVKPQTVAKVLEEIRGDLTSEHLLISIAAGVPLARLAALAGPKCRLIRVMPNTPCLVRAGASGFAVGPNATPSDAALVKRMLETVGVAFELSEGQLDAATGLSGSGPAYVYQVIEALSDGGVRMGLAREVATTLAAQTVLGAAKMVLETGRHPGELKDMVTSPGGTTIAGLAVLESRGVRGAFLAAVEAATLRSRELGRGD
jgi:pyrroline-5-carboxylate reductase